MTIGREKAPQEEFSLYHSSTIVNVNKSRRLRLAGNVARMKKDSMPY